MREFQFKHDYDLIEDYVIPEDHEEWNKCPVCGLRPKIWVFNNGSYTGCGCHNSKYDHRAIRSESIMSVVKRCNGSVLEYSRENLKENWNEFCLTGKESFLKEGQW